MTRPYLEELAPQVFAYVQPHGGWCVSNAGFVVGAGGCTVIDTAATERRARALRAALERLTPVRATTLVNTHHHGDHTFGNFVFAGEVAIIAHELARSEMAEKGLGLRYVWPDVEWGDAPLVLPSVTFADALTIHAGDLRLELRHVGPAHTTNDVVVWIPEHRVLFAGDVLLPGCTPFCLMGSVAGSLRAVAALRELGACTIVGGHGAVCGPEVFDETERYLRWIQEVAGKAVAAGVSPLEAARETDLGEFAGLLDPERVVANLHRAYAEEAGRPLGVHLSSGPVFAEMVDYNGGSPLRCLA